MRLWQDFIQGSMTIFLSSSFSNGFSCCRVFVLCSTFQNKLVHIYQKKKSCQGFHRSCIKINTSVWWEFDPWCLQVRMGVLVLAGKEGTSPSYILLAGFHINPLCWWCQIYLVSSYNNFEILKQFASCFSPFRILWLSLALFLGLVVAFSGEELGSYESKPSCLYRKQILFLFPQIAVLDQIKHFDSICCTRASKKFSSMQTEENWLYINNYEVVDLAF